MTELTKLFPSMRLVSLSGNMCTDKKPSAVNWYVIAGGVCVCVRERKEERQETCTVLVRRRAPTLWNFSHTLFHTQMHTHTHTLMRILHPA